MSESPQKKRKKFHENEEHSHTQLVKLEIVQDAGEWSPALVCAPGLNYGFETPMDVYNRKKSTPDDLFKEKLLLHSADHPKLDYVAQEEKAGDADSLLQHYIGVHDPETGRTELMPARKLILRSTLQSARVPDEKEEEIEPRKTAMDSRILLGKAFGTKKSQKALRSLTENAIVSSAKARKDSSGQLVLEDTAAVVIDAMGETYAITERQTLQEAVDEAKPRPKPNIEAQNPAQVYQLEHLAGKDIRMRLNIAKLQNAVKNNQDILTVSRYFSARLNRVAKEKQDDKLRALRLVLTMIEWKKTFRPAKRGTFYLPKDEDMKDVVTDFDPTLMKMLRQKFAPDASLSSWHIDNVCTHICALSLIVDNYTTDTFDLRQDLGLESRKMAQYFREIGCRIVPLKETEYKDFGIKTKAEAKSHTIAKLRLPLKFPKMRAQIRRR